MNLAAIEAVATCVTAIIALGGVWFVTKQLRQVERTIRASTYERLTSESFEILKFFASNPKSYPYFYKGKVLDKNDEIRVFILYAAEILANYMEHIVLQKPNMNEEIGGFGNNSLSIRVS